jgi:hypothetical protein
VASAGSTQLPAEERFEVGDASPPASTHEGNDEEDDDDVPGQPGKGGTPSPGPDPSDPSEDKDNSGGESSDRDKGSTEAPSQATPCLVNLDLEHLIKTLLRDWDRPNESRNVKVNTPNKFLGAKRLECNPFVSACELYFRAKRFRSNEDKVTFAGSYLTGVARRWFNTMTGDHKLLHDWAAFVAELKKRHGEQDPKGTAICRITQLRMKDSDHVSDYLVKFAECQALLSWEDGPGSALAVRFYDMLPHRLCKMFLYSGQHHLKMDLYELQEVAQDFDSDYWDFKNEKRANPRTET